MALESLEGTTPRWPNKENYDRLTPDNPKRIFFQILKTKLSDAGHPDEIFIEDFIGSGYDGSSEEKTKIGTTNRAYRLIGELARYGGPIQTLFIAYEGDPHTPPRPQGQFAGDIAGDISEGIMALYYQRVIEGLKRRINEEVDELVTQESSIDLNSIEEEIKLARNANKKLDETGYYPLETEIIEGIIDQIVTSELDERYLTASPNATADA